MEKVKKFSLQTTLDQFKVLLLVACVVFAAMLMNLFRAGTQITGEHLTKMLVGLVIMCVVSLVGLIIKGFIPLPIPAFAYVSLLGLLCATPWCPFQATYLYFVRSIGSTTVGTVILALTGISIGTKLSDIKRLSWRMVIVSMLVFMGTYFGSALVAQMVLKFQGLI